METVQRSKDPGINWLQRLGKWRTVFSGWQLGTRPDTDPECQAVRDHRDLSMALRAEVNALVQLCVKNGFFSAADYTAQVQEEARLLCDAYEKRFPGFRATDAGMSIDPKVAQETMRGWKP